MALCGIRAGITARSNSWSANAFTSAGGGADRKRGTDAVLRQRRKPREQQLREAAARSYVNGACQAFILPTRDTHGGFQRIQVRSHLALQFARGRRRCQPSRQALKQLAAEVA